MTLRKYLFQPLGLLLISLCLHAQTAAEYALADANDLYKAGRYWDSFFAYRNVAKTPEFASNYEVTSMISNSSKALFNKRKFEDYRAFRQYELAKQHLKNLIELNPEDPNRSEYPRLTLKQAEDLQRLAWRQRTEEATAQMLQRAIKLYHLAMTEGLKDESVQTAIRMAEMSLQKTGVTTEQPTTTLGIQPTQRIEREREVKIIKENQ